MGEINTWPAQGWKCVRHLGEGSFGKVYEISREEFGTEYRAALKVISIPQSQSDLKAAYSDGMDEQSVTDYFRGVVADIAAEFALMSKLKGHTNIVSYEDHMVLEHKDGIGWDILIRMELLTSLQDYFQLHGHSEQDVIDLGCDICRALELCQKQNIIHRDIKPENIFVNENGDYKLGDFGIARTVEKTMASMSSKGTYAYMAPEVYKSERYGLTADIYSLAVVLYRYLNENRTPFLPMGGIRYTDRETALKRRISGEPVPAPVHGSGQLKAVILKALAYRPEDRYQTPLEFRRALEACAGQDEPVPEPKRIPQPEPPAPPVQPQERTEVQRPFEQREKTQQEQPPAAVPVEPAEKTELQRPFEEKKETDQEQPPEREPEKKAKAGLSLKRVLAFVAALIFVAGVGSLGWTEFQKADVVDSGTCGDLAWTLDSNGTLTISGSGPMGYVALENDSWLDAGIKDQIKKVSIEMGATSIGYGAFQDCVNLTNITIPNTVTSIDGSVFLGCTSLEEVTIPNSVNYIGSFSFSRCTSLHEIIIPDNVDSVGKYAFSSCTNLTNVTLPEGLEVDGSVFKGCDKLER